MPTSTVEDYLKTVYRLGGRDNGLVPLGKIAEDLGVTPGTATTMVKQISRQGSLEYVARKGARLTRQGLREVLSVVRRHRLIELFLVETMEYDWSEVHEEAEILEHAVSDRLIDRIDKMLGYPARDPHGDPIPDQDGRIRNDDAVRLSECGTGTFELIRVRRKTRELLVWLSETGIEPGGKIELLGHDPLPNVYSLRVADSERVIHLGPEVIECLWVIELNS